MKKVYIMQHQRGNHSPFQVYNYGKIIFSGGAMEARQELKEFRKFYRSQWYEANTNDKQCDYVAYRMGDKFAVEIVDGKPQWFY